MFGNPRRHNGSFLWFGSKAWPEVHVDPKSPAAAWPGTCSFLIARTAIECESERAGFLATEIDLSLQGQLFAAIASIAGLGAISRILSQ